MRLSLELIKDNSILTRRGEERSVFKTCLSYLQVPIPLSIFLSFLAIRTSVLAIRTGGLVDKTKTLDILDKVLLMTFLYNFFTTFFSFPSFFLLKVKNSRGKFCSLSKFSK